MLKKIRIANWLLEVDVDKTQEFYKKDIEMCTCLSCSNFAEASKHLDVSIAALFNKLGINPAKPGHLSDYPALEDGRREYEGCYHLIGRVIEGELCKTYNWNDTNTAGIKNFTIGFSEDLAFVPEDFPEPILQLEFVATIPWLLEEKGINQ